MPTYISKKAIDSIPILAQNIPIEPVSSALKSSLLNSDLYLSGLSRNELDRKSLSPNNTPSTYDTVLRIKGALEAIAYFETEYLIPGNVFIDRTGDYDPQMVEAIMDFQSFAGLPVNGVVDSNTLIEIDSYFDKHRNTVISQNSKFIGERPETQVEIMEKQTDDVFSYAIEVDGLIVAYYSNDPLQVVPVVKEYNQTGLFYAILPTKAVSDINLQRGSSLEFNTVVSFDESKISSIDGYPFHDNIDLLTVINSRAPQILSENDATLYKIGSNDKLADIVISNYYGSAVDIVDPYTDDLIYQLPEHTVSQPQDRPDDIRFKFYLNLLYYYNIEIDQDGGVKEYGIKAATGTNQYNRYDDERLNDYNIYDNTLSDNDPESVFPNYYRFLKFMAEQPTNPTEIVFDSQGNPTSFMLDSTKYIWIPSRKFADGLFYQLNFRHDEMLVEHQNSYEYVSEEIMDSIIQQMQQKSIWNTITDFAKGLFVEIYNETLEFYKKMYNFAITSLAQFYPRGMGMYLESNAGVTWGYPIATDVAGNTIFWRKMTSINELVFVMQQETSVGAGLDVAAGYSAGFKLGKGKKQRSIGFRAGTGLEAKLVLTTRIEYEFPIRPEESGLINFLLSFTNATRATADILGSLNVTNVSPQNYLTSSKINMDFQSTVWVAAQAGFINGNSPEINNNITVVNNDQNLAQMQESKTNSFLSIDSITNKIPFVGGSATGEVVLGTSFEYRAKYENKPLVPEKSGRVPSETEVINAYYFQGTLTAGGLGGLIQKILGNIALGPLSLLDFDNGIEFAVTNKYVRNTSSKNITFQDTVLDTDTLVTDPNSPELRYNQGKWSTLVSVARFTGAPDIICTPGTEGKFTINASKLIQLIVNAGSSYNFPNLGELLDIFYSYSYLYKTGFGFNSTQKLGLVGSAYGTLSERGGGLATGVTREFLKRANSDSNPLGVDAYLGFHVKAELKIGEAARQLLEYFMKKIYISDKIELPEDKKEFEMDVDQIEKKIEDELTNSIEHLRETEKYTVLNYFFRSDNPEFTYNTYLANLELKNVFKSMLLVYRYFNIFLAESKTYLFGQNQNNINNNEKDQLISKKDAQKMYRGLIYIAQLLNIDFALEAKLGIAASGEIRAGAGATLRIALGGAGGLMAQMKFMEEGNLVGFTNDDPYKKTFVEIGKMLSVDNYSKTGIRKSFLDKA